ncbi:hypothetical protein GPJ56_010430 [Histomonas meleagridis]|uniref:uncharacterized protein n=1 Tax=Histomonas meleagridis TaxID=135588 RepID=UPI0035597547|nr:hypothetical protein GPJ56_010430 [Histomonas meleagridis]KAH0799011.1 hypothetical protein GO595_008163 [Histomonas meleagridis]
MESQSPFWEKSWSWFGFDGPPEAGVDYSWIQVQEDLNFIGFKNVIKSCVLYFSSRYPNTYLIKTRDGILELWNVSDCSFSLLTKSSSILLVANGPYTFHLADASSTLIELLMNTRKLPLNSMLELETESIPIIFTKTSASKEMPEPSVNLLQPASQQCKVVLTGTGVENEFHGEFDYSKSEIKITNEESDFTIKMDDIINIDITIIGKTYLVVALRNEKRIEIAFDESNTFEAKRFYSNICEEIGKQKNED